MTNWSGFYDEPGKEDTEKAAYLHDLTDRVEKSEIRFTANSQILLFGCNLDTFSQKLSAITKGTVIGPSGSAYPEIWGNRETGAFLTTNWVVYRNGSFAYSAGKRLNAW